MIIRSALLHHKESGRWLSFREPLALLSAHNAQEVRATLREVEARVESEGLTAVGFVTYEAASGFDTTLPTHNAGAMPLLCFGLFRHATEVAAPTALAQGAGQLWRFTQGAADYRGAIAEIRELIAAGSVYQINHTTRLQGIVSDAASLFAEVAAGAPHAAYIEGDSHTIISASPECFFSLNGDVIYSQPMKGTVAREADPQADHAKRDWLAASRKNQAENLMITDMVRNDLGRIAQPGSVAVSELFALEQYPTVWQMTSRIEARTEASITEIFQQLFPAASITGAPKRAAMQQIVSLETSPREIYTGAIGFIAPQRQAHFNIAIRTAWVDNATQVARYGAGGGVVWDSQPEEEHGELVSKTQILRQVSPWEDFALFETMAWCSHTGPAHLAEHLQRMARSAAYFGIDFSHSAALAAISCAAEQHAQTASEATYRLRLVLDGSGEFSAQLEDAPLTSADVQKVALVPWQVYSKDPALAHKTTQRHVYAQARAAVVVAHGPATEPLLVNERGEVTETDIANVVFSLAGRLYTPPCSSGLLPGILREVLLQAGELQERVLLVEHLAEVEALYLINDLRGWRTAQLTNLQPTS